MTLVLKLHATKKIETPRQLLILTSSILQKQKGFLFSLFQALESDMFVHDKL
jgi:hypothetical protein